MARWSSIATAGLAALIAVPVSSHYVVPKETAPVFAVSTSGEAQVVPGRRVSGNGSAGTNSIGSSAAATKTAIEALHQGKADALQEGQEAIADLMCAYTRGDKDKATNQCPADPINDATVMIATVPDPVHTHLALRFDREIDAIEDSLQQLGWIYDRSWLPWDNTPHKAPDRWEARAYDNAMQDAVESLPGVMLFRLKNSIAFGEDEKKPSSQHLIILLVSEKPTSGVNVEQFKTALNYWTTPATLFRVVPPDPHPATAITNKTLTILGPNFTGSLFSLNSLLDQRFTIPSLCPAEPPIQIFSGAVADGDTLKAISQQPCRLIKAVSFSASSSQRKAQISSFLQKRNPDIQVAFVSERESNFGANQSKEGNTRAYPNAAGESDRKAGGDSGYQNAKNTSGKTGKGNAKADATLGLSFPREISQLRRAYEKNGVIGFSQTAEAPHTGLQLTAPEDESEGDTLETFSGATGVVTMEAEMAGLARSLQVNNIGVAIVSATDVLDTIFVTRYLMQHVPDLTVIMEDSDELFLHGGADASLDNVYVASPWPLMEANELWTRQGDGSSFHDTFTSESDQGIFTAVHYAVCLNALRDKKDSLPDEDVNKNCSAKTFREYISPFSGETEPQWRPPLWVSVIEHGKFQPIALLGDDKQQDTNLPTLDKPLPGVEATPKGKGIITSDASEGRANSADEHNPLSIKLLATAIIALLALHGWACWRCRLDRRFAWIYAAAEQQQRNMRPLVKAALPLLGGAALWLLYIPRVPRVPALDIQSFGFHLVLIAGEALALLVALLALFGDDIKAAPTTMRAAKQLAKQRTNSWLRFAAAQLVVRKFAARRRLLLATMLVTGIVFAIVFKQIGLSVLIWISRLDQSERYLFLFRSSSPFDGASPLLPLLLLLGAFAVVVGGTFTRLAFFGHRIPKLPDHRENLRCPSNGCVKGLVDLLAPAGFVAKQTVKMWLRTKRSALLLLAGGLSVMALGMRLSGHAIRSLDQARLDWLATGCTILLGALMLQNLGTAFAAWRLLRDKLLIPLKHSPLRWGFTWVKGWEWKRIWSSSSSLKSNQVFDYLFRLLQISSRSTWGGKDTRYAERFRKFYSSGPNNGLDPNFAGNIENLLNAIKYEAEGKLDDLERKWQEDYGPITGRDPVRGTSLQDELKGLKEEDRKTALRRMQDEEFVALLYVGYITMVLIQIRHRVLTAAVLYMLLLGTLTCYPWMYRHTILLGLIALFAVLAVVVIMIYSEMHRDDILSRTTETTTGKLDGGFWEKIIPVLGIPLLSLIASQFPEVSNFLFSWVQPGLSKF